MTITKNAIEEMSKAILEACERRDWNPYELNQEQLKEIVTVVLGTPTPAKPTRVGFAELKALASGLDVRLVAPGVTILNDFLIGVDLAKLDTTDTSAMLHIVKGRDGS